MATPNRGGSSIVQQAVKLARLVKRHTAAGSLAYGMSLPAATAISLAADLIIALDALGAFDGQGGSAGMTVNLQLEQQKAQLLQMDRAAMVAYLQAE